MTTDNAPVGNALDNDLSKAFGEMLKAIYGKENIALVKEISGEKFVAALSNLVFDIVIRPDKLNTKRIKTALINNYNIELVYFVPAKVPGDFPRITFKYIGDYVRTLQYLNRSDIVRWINQIRNKIEDSNERANKKKSFHVNPSDDTSKSDLR